MTASRAATPTPRVSLSLSLSLGCSPPFSALRRFARRHRRRPAVARLPSDILGLAGGPGTFPAPPAVADYEGIYHHRIRTHLVAPLDSRTKRRHRRARFPSFRHLPSPPSFWPPRRWRRRRAPAEHPTISMSRSSWRAPAWRRSASPLTSSAPTPPPARGTLPRPCRWSGPRPPFGSSAASSLLATKQWISSYY